MNPVSIYVFNQSTLINLSQSDLLRPTSRINPLLAKYISTLSIVYFYYKVAVFISGFGAENGDRQLSANFNST